MVENWFYFYSFDYLYSHENGFVSVPFIYDNNIYGIDSNPIYQISNYGIFDKNGYQIDKELIRGAINYRRLIGTDGTPGAIGIGTDRITINNVKISGRWRSKNVWYPLNMGSYIIPLLFTAYYKNGSIKACNYIGSNTSNYGRNSKSSRLVWGNLDNSPLGSSYIVDNSLGDYEETEMPFVLPENSEYYDMVFDFGNIEQDCPEFLLEFFTQNFDRLYENQYTVYNENSEQVAQSEPEQPSITKTNLTYAADSYQLSLTRVDGQIITLTWLNSTPENKVFKGLGIEPNSSEIVVPIGEREVLIEKSTNFYMVYGEYTPPPVPPDPPPLPTYEESQLPRPQERPLPEGAYNANCYTNTAEANRVDKSNYLTPVRTIHGVLREPTSVTDMVMTIQYPHYPDFNYIRIPELKRYYFVNDITIINANLYELDLSVDPLMSYKEAILGLTAFVDRNEFLSNPMIIDKKRVVMQGVNIEENEIRNGFFLQPIDEENDIRFVITGYKISAGYAPDTTP